MKRRLSVVCSLVSFCAALALSGFVPALGVQAATPGAPPAPTALKPTAAATDTSITWSFIPPDNVSNIAVSDGTQLYALPPGSTSFTKSSMPKGSYACISVAAYTTVVSDWTPFACALTRPASPHFQPGPLILGATTTSVTIGWWNENDSTSYIAINDGTTITPLGQNASSYTITGLTPGYYGCRSVAAYNAGLAAYGGAPYSSAFSPWACAFSQPLTPTGLIVSSQTTSSVTFTWTVHDPYATIFYARDRSTVNLGTAVTTYTVDNLSSGQQVCISVKAGNWSAYSDLSPVVCGNAA